MQMPFIRKLNSFVDFNKIIDECQQLLARIPFENNITQLSLQVDDPNVNDWYSTCGSVFKTKLHMANEIDYKYIQPELKGSAIEQWINTFDFPLYKTRLMLVAPKTCYSIHRDLSPRIHLPVISNSDCLMCFPELGEMEHMPANGYSYWADTRQRHTFINCSNQNRIHLVSTINWYP